ncbi:hypothetical protein ACMSI6_16040 [Pseudomonas antarctica]|uniref:hypothetical protein n=1 Tax=Pseudomonas antarctica TaxID=219572 RepID=UPI0039C259E8
MDIQRLLKKRQLNVQEQNALTAHWLMVCAKACRANGTPPALKDYGETQGLNWSQTLVIKLEIDFCGMPSLWGLLLTQSDRFISFEIETDATHQQIESIELWEDQTDAQDLSISNRGTGKGFGALALQVKSELLAQP